MNPSFSILVPAFKKAFLKECIDSILSQDYSDFEIIVINDNSPYDLDSIIQTYDSEKLLYKKNRVGFGGHDVVKNWNECLNEANGSFIICMGDDDKLLPHCLSNYAELIKKHPTCDLFHTNTQIINSASQVIDIQESRPKTESVYSMLWHRWYGGRSKQFIGDFTFRTKTLRQIGGFCLLPYGWHSDILTACAVARNGGIVNSDHYGFQYRVNEMTISYSTSNYKDKIKATILANRWYAEFLNTADPVLESDKLFLSFLKERFHDHEIETFKSIVKDDLCYNGVIRNFLFWMKNRQTISFSRKQLLSVAMLAIHKKVSHRRK